MRRRRLPASVVGPGLLALVGATHLLDHTVLPRRLQLASHVATAAVAVAAAFGSGASADELGLSPGRLRAGLREGLTSGAAITGVVAMGALLPRTRRLFLDERVRDVGVGEAAWRGLVEIPIGTAVYEELLFRGVGLGLSERRLGPVGATIATSASFGAWHVLPSLRDRALHPATRDRNAAVVSVATVVNTALVGFLLARQRTRSGSVLAPIITHASLNGVTYLVAALVARSAGPDRPPRGPREPQPALAGG